MGSEWQSWLDKRRATLFRAVFTGSSEVDWKECKDWKKKKKKKKEAEEMKASSQIHGKSRGFPRLMPERVLGGERLETR